MIFGFPRQPRADAFASLREAMLSFESLGDNCEFGLAQRYCGAEPLGLFRFASVGLDPLIEALDTDFRDYGGENDLVIMGTAFGGLACRSRRYGFVYHTNDLAEQSDAAAVLKRETTKVRYLKRRLLEDLADGQKVLVRKAAPGEGPDDVARLLAAIRRQGGCRLLHVRETGRGEPIRVRRHALGWIEGAIPRFAPTEEAHALNLEAWIELCVAVHAELNGSAPAFRPAQRRNRLSLPWRRGGRHELAGGTDLEILGDYQRARNLTLGAIHTYSAWVWIPRSFDGSRIGAAIGGARLGWRDADLSLREAWQRVWLADRLPQQFLVLMMGLVASGPAGARFWSGGHRLEEGPIPGPAAPPRWTPLRGR